MSQLSRLPAHGFIPEPELKFHPERPSDTHSHPLKGLSAFGPYSRSVFGAVADPIRIAVISPADGLKPVEELLKSLDGFHRPRERRAYLIDYKGFSSIFGVRAVLAKVRISLSKSLDSQISSAERPHQVLAEHLTRAVSALKADRSGFDLVITYLPDRWEEAFTGSDDSFDLHDYLKGVTATAGIPAQIVLEGGAMAYPCRCSVMWRLGIAIYTKAGGIPWKLAHMDVETAYVGLGYAIRFNEDGTPTFVTCCSQVFDHDGTGLEFVAYETPDMRVERGNPFLDRTEMHRVAVLRLAGTRLPIE